LGDFGGRQCFWGGDGRCLKDTGWGAHKFVFPCKLRGVTGAHARALAAWLSIT
jgi:hypothetical protein